MTKLSNSYGIENIPASKNGYRIVNVFTTQHKYENVVATPKRLYSIDIDENLITDIENVKYVFTCEIKIKGKCVTKLEYSQWSEMHKEIKKYKNKIPNCTVKPCSLYNRLF